ncbi:MAG: MarR family transcriptional regulator [Herpetosiphonaceae bacterium]|nr:MarR family transcriptional regulator [Herpetosiphonaceae bacterium]
MAVALETGVHTNARRLLRLLDAMREHRPRPTFAQLNHLNLSFSHLRLLQLLAPNHSLAMKELAEEMQITPPSVTTLTRRLVETELVERRSHAEDSRVVLLSLTEAGRTLLRRLYEDHLHNMERLLQGLSTEDQELFLDLLERAVQTLQTGTPIGRAP